MDLSYTLHAYTAPERSALLVGRRQAAPDPSRPWLTREDVDQVLKSCGKGRVFLRLRDNRAGEVYADEGWSDEIG